MIRAIFATIGIFSTVILLAQVSALGLLWSRGYLSASTLREIRLAIQQDTESEVDAEKEDKVPDMPSETEVKEARVVRVLDLQVRENELSFLKRMTTESANQLISDREAFDELKTGFRQELDRLKADSTAASTEQIRTVLLASPPEESVNRLMGLTVEEGTNLLRGLPEKSIAKILQAFQLDAKSVERGKELFEALYRGEPERSLIQKTMDQLETAPGEPISRAG
ncbi:hypothetical protein GC163_06365 [bacterium]|nr:hypothetical protein [bacterium]